MVDYTEGSGKQYHTAVTVDISDDVIFGKENTIVVKVDSRENQNIPPFGYVIDYMTYGGIYRDVYLEISEQSFISDVYVTTKQAKKYQDSEGVSWQISGGVDSNNIENVL